MELGDSGKGATAEVGRANSLLCLHCDTPHPKGLITRLRISRIPLIHNRQSCSRRSWVAPLVSVPSRPLSRHVLSPTAPHQRLARPFSRANADFHPARLHARPTVTRTARASLLLPPSPNCHHLVRQNLVRAQMRSPTRPVAMSRPPRMKLLATCPVCLRQSTSSRKVRGLGRRRCGG